MATTQYTNSLTSNRAGLQVVASRPEAPIPPSINAGEAKKMWELYRAGRSVPAIRIARRPPKPIGDKEIIDELICVAYQNGHERGAKEGF